MTRKVAGFTLLECLIAMLVISAILCIALPSYMNSIATARVVHAESVLFEHLTDSMRHSIVGGSSVVMCISPDGSQCSSGTSWSGGWIAFADIDDSRSRDPNEPVIRHQKPLANDVRMIGSTGRPRLVFKAHGGNPGSNTTFTLCDVAGRARARSVLLANNGRLRKAWATDSAGGACRGQ